MRVRAPPERPFAIVNKKGTTQWVTEHGHLTGRADGQRPRGPGTTIAATKSHPTMDATTSRAEYASMTSAKLARTTTVLRTRLPDGGDNAVPRGYTKCGAPLGVVVHAETFTGIEWRRRTNPRPATRSHVEVVATNFSPDGYGGALCAPHVEDSPCAPCARGRASAYGRSGSSPEPSGELLVFV